MRRAIAIYCLAMMLIATFLYLILSALSLLPNDIVTTIYWTHITVGTLAFGVSLLYLHRYRQTSISALFYIFLSTLSFLIFYIVQAVSISLLNAGGNQGLSRMLYYIGVFLGGLGPSFFVVFISAYVYEQVRVKELILPLIYLGMLLSYIVNDQLFGAETKAGFVFFEYKPSVIWLNTVGLLMYLYVGWYSIYRIRQTRTRLRNPSLRQQQNLFMAGTALVYMSAPFVFALVTALPTTALQFYWINVVAPTYIIAGISITAIPYITSDKAAFLQPQPLHQLIVIRQGGVPVLSYSFDKVERLRVNDMLFSSAVTAVSSLMEEALDTTLRSLGFENRTALTRFDEELAFVVIIDFVTDVIKQGLNRFADLFTGYFHSTDLGQIVIDNLQEYPEVEQMVLDNFGY